MAKASRHELTLTLEPAERFVRGDDFVRALTAFLKGAKSLSQSAANVEWVISGLKQGSAVVSVTPIGDVAAGASAIALGTSILSALDAGERIPGEAPDEFLDAIREIGELAAKRKFKASVTNGKAGVVVTAKIVDSIEGYRDVGSTEEFGTVEGSLDGINVHGALQCHVYTDMGNHKVAVEFAKDQLADVKNALGNRVSVRGTITFSRQGRPLSVTGAKIRRFESDENLPTTDDMLGIAPDITSGEPVDRYIRTLRESDGE